MKKILSFVFISVLFSLVSFVSADLYEPHRIFELGFETEVGASNNTIKAEEILVKDVVINLQDLYDHMPGEGLTVDFHGEENFFMNLNISSRFRFSFFSGLEENAYVNVDKKLFGILANGLSVSENKVIDFNGYADVFYKWGASYQTIIHNYGVKITPVYYIPLVYMPQTDAKARVFMSPTGEVSISAATPVEVYTAIDMEKFIEDDQTVENLDYNYADVLSSGGFDLSFEIERNWLAGLNAGVYTQIPLIPGRMKHKITTYLDAYLTETNVFGVLEDAEAHDFDYDMSDKIYSSANYKVWRPFKLGINAEYRPLGPWMTFRPKLGFAVRDLYKSSRIFYPEYDLPVVFTFHEAVGLELGTGYQNRTFRHYLGIFINCRVLEIDAKAALSSTDFINSFRYTGASGYIGVKMGF